MTDETANAIPEPLPDDAPANDPGFNLDVPGATRERPLTPAARRALEEAAERLAVEAAAMDVEHGGPTGPEPPGMATGRRRGWRSTSSRAAGGPGR